MVEGEKKRGDSVGRGSKGGDNAMLELNVVLKVFYKRPI
jgi:hypothetical protein